MLSIQMIVLTGTITEIKKGKNKKLKNLVFSRFNKMFDKPVISLWAFLNFSGLLNNNDTWKSTYILLNGGHQWIRNSLVPKKL